ncbi:uncharacterized protein [Panulirus ornatus]|uniref:uncharacterized protein n=1 Tax=Panulirus ornatus TaxID=150431 RepID=UPI003A87EC7B
MPVYSNNEVAMMSPEGSSSPEAGEEVRERVFACTMCSYRTDRKNNLKRHTLTMHEVCPALLECCGLRFLNKAELRMHTNKFHRHGYHCDVCNRVFCRKALLKRHYSVHSGYKEFSCHRCNYQTSHKSNLERHMRVHQKPEPPLGTRQPLPPEYLPQLSPARRHVSPAMNLQQAFLPAHPLALLPHYHGGAHLYRRGGSSSKPSPWSMLPVSPAGVHAALHRLPPPQVFGVQGHHRPGPGPRMARASHKKTRSPCNFSMAALLADRPTTQDNHQPEMTPSATLHQHLHLPPHHGSTWWSVRGEETWPPVQTAATSSGHAPAVSTPSYMSSGVVKPTALHANPVNTAFHANPINTAFHANPINTAFHANPVDTAFHANPVDTAFHANPVNTAYHANPVDTAFHANPVDTAFHANPVSTAVHAGSPDYALDLTSAPTTRQVCYMAEVQGATSATGWQPATETHTDDSAYLSERDGSRSQRPSLGQTPAPDHQDCRASSGYGSPGVTESPKIPGSTQSSEDGVECALNLKVELHPEQLLHVDFDHDSAYLVERDGSRSQRPSLGQTPAPDHQDCRASSGYRSPGVTESPKIPGSTQSSEDGVECALNLKVELHPEQLLHVDFDQDYVPKKLRLSKRFRDVSKSSGDLL